MSKEKQLPAYLFFEINVSPVCELIGKLAISVNTIKGNSGSKFSARISNCDDRTYYMSQKMGMIINNLHVIRICFDLKDDTNSIDKEILNDLNRYFEFENNLSKKYRAFAKDIANNYIRFLKYTTMVPYLTNITDYSNDLYTFVWLNADKRSIEDITQDFSQQAAEIKRQKVQFGAGEPKKKYTEVEIEQFLVSGVTEDIILELLVDAESALAIDSPRRAVVELASACEIKINQHISGSAFKAFKKSEEYNSRLGVIEMADLIFGKKYGKGFRIDAPDDYESVVKLYKLRNSIVHRGEMTYKLPDQPKVFLNSKDSATLHKLSKSVRVFIDWVESNIPPKT